MAAGHAMPTGDDNSGLPLYGCLTGIELPAGEETISPGVSLRATYSVSFGTTMLAFARPSRPKAVTPGPWAPVMDGGFHRESLVELAITDLGEFEGIDVITLAWLVAFVMRLNVPSPIRLAVIANMPFDRGMADNAKALQAVEFESAPQQVGPFFDAHTVLNSTHIDWARYALPVAAKLYLDDRFFRAMTVYDQARWSPTNEIATVLAWTALEVLLDKSAAPQKKKALTNALLDYVGLTGAERDRAVGIVHRLYEARGGVVHAARRISDEDTKAALRLARSAFQQVLRERKLPTV